LKNFSAKDIAAGVQSVFEHNIIEYLKIFISQNDYQTVYLSGGAFANVKLNQRIAQLSKVRDLVVAPNMGDGGLSLGAAQYVHPRKSQLRSLYLGPAIKSIDHSVQKSFGIEKISTGGKSLSFKCAEILNDKKIIAVARDRMEWGPRALCNRSILLTANDQDVNSWLNKKLKRNSFFIKMYNKLRYTGIGRRLIELDRIAKQQVLNKTSKGRYINSNDNDPNFASITFKEYDWQMGRSDNGLHIYTWVKEYDANSPGSHPWGSINNPINLRETKFKLNYTLDSIIQSNFEEIKFNKVIDGAQQLENRFIINKEVVNFNTDIWFKINIGLNHLTLLPTMLKVEYLRYK
jgi:hypothetical protein